MQHRCASAQNCCTQGRTGCDSLEQQSNPILDFHGKRVLPGFVVTGLGVVVAGLVVVVTGLVVAVTGFGVVVTGCVVVVVVC